MCSVDSHGEGLDAEEMEKDETENVHCRSQSQLHRSAVSSLQVVLILGSSSGRIGCGPDRQDPWSSPKSGGWDNDKFAWTEAPSRATGVRNSPNRR